MRDHNKRLLGHFGCPTQKPSNLDLSDIRLDNVCHECYNGMSVSNAQGQTSMIRKSGKHTPNTGDPPGIMKYLLTNQIQIDKQETRKKAQIATERRLNKIRPKKNICKDLSLVKKVLFLDNSKTAQESGRLRTEGSTRSRGGGIDTDFSRSRDSGGFESSLGFGIVDAG